MDGMCCLKTIIQVVTMMTPMNGVFCLQIIDHMVKREYLWMGCPVYKQ